MKRLRDLMEKRQKAVVSARAITEAAERENNRALTEEEQRNFDAAMADQERLRVQIEQEQRLAQVESELVAASGASLEGGDRDQRSGRNGHSENAGAARTIGEGRYAQRLDDLDPAAAQMLQRRSSTEYVDGFRRFIRNGEQRALDAGSTGANGAFLITPVQMALGLLQALDDQVFIRPLATVFQVPTAASLGRVSLDGDADDLDWTPELQTGNEDDGLAFGKRELTPHAMAKLVKISNRLLRMATIDPMQLAIQRLAYKKGLTEEKQFLTGSGIQRPLGIFTASNDGIPTSRDIATGNAATAITFDGLISAKYGLKAGYLRNARWLFSRTAVAQIAKIRDDSGAGVGTGGYIWQPSQQLGQPDRIHGIPVLMSEHVPATFTSGLYVGAIADFSFYHIADALDMQIQRLAELFALTNRTGLVLRAETDGMPVLAEAFVRVKLG